MGDPEDLERLYGGDVRQAKNELPTPVYQGRQKIQGHWTDHVSGVTYDPSSGHPEDDGPVPHCRHCGFEFSGVASESFIPHPDADVLEVGAHMALNHPDELRKTHPHLFR